jgi:hypothetical protein
VKNELTQNYIKTIEASQAYTHSDVVGDSLLFNDMDSFVNDLQMELALVGVIMTVRHNFSAQSASSGASVKFDAQLSYAPVFSADESIIGEVVVSSEIRSTATPALDFLKNGYENVVWGNFKDEIARVVEHKGVSVSGSQTTSRVEAPSFKGSAVFLNSRSRLDTLEGSVPSTRATIRATLFFKKAP